MLKIYFVGPTGVRTPAGDNLSELVIERDRIRLSAEQDAVHERHTLVWEGKVHIVLRVESSATVHFERDRSRSPEYGPFPVLTMVDGLLLTSLDAESPLARFEFNTKSWIEPTTMIVWDRIIITDWQESPPPQ